eukprot:5767292-Pyramimonas_sp.AAC.1
MGKEIGPLLSSKDSLEHRQSAKELSDAIKKDPMKCMALLETSKCEVRDAATSEYFPADVAGKTSKRA